VSDLAIESTPAVAKPAEAAARGKFVYITERGQRVATIVSAELAAALERLSADDLEVMAAAAESAGNQDAADLLENLADRAAVLESRADPGPGIPWDEVKSAADE
jgi:antitoxin (DNA-binding transcriptional repressor) of toxin-antitoxin stability system